MVRAEERKGRAKRVEKMSGITTLVRALFWKARDPMAVTLFPIVTLVRSLL